MIRNERRSWRFVVGVILVTLFALFCIVPLIYMILVSFAHTSTMYIKWDDIKLFDFSNYVYLFQNRDFARPILNSLIVVIISVIAVDLVSCTMAYGFEKKPIPGKKGLFNIVLSTMMIPTQVVFISLYVMMRKWHMLNTYIALVIPLIGAFGIFMLRQNFMQVPKELIEAARLDKAGELKIMFKIMLPMSRSTVATLALLTFIGTWNDYFWAKVLTTSDAVRTLPVGITALSDVDGGVANHIIMAGNLIMMVPILIAFVIAQKQILKAFAYTGVK